MNSINKSLPISSHSYGVQEQQPKKDISIQLSIGLKESVALEFSILSQVNFLADRMADEGALPIDRQGWGAELRLLSDILENITSQKNALLKGFADSEE